MARVNNNRKMCKGFKKRNRCKVKSVSCCCFKSSYTSFAKNNIVVEKEETQDSANYTFDIPYVTPNTDFNPDGADIDISGGHH